MVTSYVSRYAVSKHFGAKETVLIVSMKEEE